MNVVVYRNIHDKFATTNITFNLKNVRKFFKIDSTQLCFIKNKLTYFQLGW